MDLFAYSLRILARLGPAAARSRPRGSLGCGGSNIRPTVVADELHLVDLIHRTLGKAGRGEDAARFAEVRGQGRGQGLAGWLTAAV